MASAAPAPQLPLFYNRLEPLSNQRHGSAKLLAAETAPWLSKAHAVPVTSDEFIAAQRFYPIVFSSADDPVPLALMGLNEGVNVFVDDEGKLHDPVYIPAYLRRYPFMLAKLRQDSDQMSLCFDPEAGLVSDTDEGQPLFDGEQPSETTKSILAYCEEFERSAHRTAAFVDMLKSEDLFMQGELSIQPAGAEKPFIYRGFKMVAEEKLRDLRGDVLRKLNQNGGLALIMAHLFSLQLAQEIFAKQVVQGKMPGGEPPATMPPVESGEQPLSA